MKIATSVFNPYPGLRPFRETEAHLFFGRGQQIDDLLAELGRSRFVAVMGASGSGKSSLVRAGLLPSLHGGFSLGVGSQWRMATFRPGGNPIHNLARALAPPTVIGNGDLDEAASVARMEATLRRSGMGLADATRSHPALHDGRLLVVVDQFEELFRFATLAADTEAVDDAATFVQLLIEATRDPTAAVDVVITMRSDFLGDCSQFRDLPETINEGIYLVPRLTRGQLREAVSSPAKVGGGELTPRLVQRILNDAGADPDLLPVVQHTLMRTWDLWATAGRTSEPLDLAHYDASGGLENALSLHADEAYEALGDDRRRRVAEQMFKRLTELGADRREVRRPSPLIEIAAVTGAAVDEIRDIIGSFEQQGRSFLTVSTDGVVDISHESLIRQWPRLRSWVREEAESRDIYRRLANAADRHRRREAALLRNPDLQRATQWWDANEPNQAWADRYDPEFESAADYLRRSRKAAIRRRGYLVIAVAVLAVMALVSAVLAVEASASRAEALDEKRRAEDAAAQADLEKQRAIAAEGAALEEKARAEEAARRARTAEIAALDEKARAEEAELAARDEKARAEDAALRARTAELAARDEKSRAEDAALRARTAELVARDEKARAEDAAVRARTAELVARDEKARAEDAAVRARDAERVARDAELAALDEKARAEGAAAQADLEKRRAIAAEGAAKRSADAARDAKAASDRLRAEADEARNAALDEKARARAGELAAASLIALRRNPPLAMLLALEAARTTEVANRPLAAAQMSGVRGQPVPAAVQALQTAAAAPLDAVLTHGEPVTAAAFAPDGSRIVTASGEVARIWDVAKPDRPVATIPVGSAIRSVAFNRAGTRIVVVADVPSVWDVSATPTKLTELRAARHTTTGATFSPDGSRIVTASSDGNAYVWDPAAAAPLVGILRHLDWVNTAAYNHDGTRIVTASDDGNAYVWDPAAPNQPLDTLPHGDRVNTAAYNHDGTRIVTTTFGAAHVWDPAAPNQPLETFPHDDWVNTAAYNHDGTRIVTTSGNAARIWGAAPIVQATLTHDQRVVAAQFRASDGRVVTASDDGTARVWDPSRPEVRALVHRAEVEHEHSEPATSASISPDGTRIVTASGDGNAYVWDPAAPDAPITTLPHNIWVTSAAYNHDGTRIITATFGAAHVWDPAAPSQPLDTLPHDDWVNTAAYNHDGTRIVTAGDDGARVWDAAGRQPVALQRTTQSTELVLFPVSAVTLDAAGRRVLSAAGRAAYVWDPAAPDAPITTLPHDNSVNTAAYNHDGTRIVTATFGAAHVWDPAAPDAPITTLPHDGWVNSAAYNHDGTRIVTAGDDGARIWDSTGKLRAQLQQGPVHDAAYNAQGTRIVTGGPDGAHIWDAAGKKLVTLQGVRSVNAVAFSRDGQFVVTASADEAADIWRADGNPVRTLPHDAEVLDAAFSRDGTLVVTASADGLVRVWDIGGTQLATREHTGPVNSAVFTPDGSSVVSASDDGTVRIWRWPTIEEAKQQLRNRLGSRTFTAVECAQFGIDPCKRPF